MLVGKNSKVPSGLVSTGMWCIWNYSYFIKIQPARFAIGKMKEIPSECNFNAQSIVFELRWSKIKVFLYV